MNRETDLFAYQTLKALALTHNYNQWIFGLFKPYLGRRVLEVGCGIGNLTQYLAPSCGSLTGIDISPYFLEHLRIDYPKMELHAMDIAGDEVLTLKSGFDTVICVNILEHVEDDARALSNIYRLLSPGGHLLLFVPAMRWLYGTLDESLDHHRRYEKGPLSDLLRRTGFTVDKSFYSNFPGMFGWFVNGRLLKRRRFPILQPLVFDKFVPLLTRAEKLLPLPCGMSLTAVARKPEQGK